MAEQEISDEEIKADLMHRLLRKHCWEAKYLPMDTLVNWVSKKIKGNGKRIRKCIGELVKEGHIILHKGGRAISLSSMKSREIAEYIKKVLEI
ncbi:MAG: hypothetical protein QW265_05515 [Candidatus Bathyarchaeia archaeon]